LLLILEGLRLRSLDALTAKHAIAAEILKEAAREAISADANQYSITWGTKPFREAIARKTRAFCFCKKDETLEEAKNRLARL